MFFSTFEIFKIGIGPSSSHTIGPMVAARRFLDQLRTRGLKPAGFRASLHGSLAFTGRGHATDRAVMLGLAGFEPATFDADRAEFVLDQIRRNRLVHPPGLPPTSFDPDHDLVFDYERQLPGHSNGMILFATDADGELLLRETYYSIGGGTVLTEAEQKSGHCGGGGLDVPYNFLNASDLVEMASRHPEGIPGLVHDNELTIRPAADIATRIRQLWCAMDESINRGLSSQGVLPGGLGTRRRARDIHHKLISEIGSNAAAPHTVNDWISIYAMAVNEENAGGGRIVTAPTNGAAGVVPATIKYYLEHVPGADQSMIADFLFTAAAIGGIIKQNASISGADCGCQAEVGSAAAMAAAGLCQILGGTPSQVENASEIALEHHLGLTCDPVMGLVQVPCIERNGMGAVKAISAASLSLRGDGLHLISLDACIDTMRRTGADMSTKYKETSLGGLAVSIANC